MIELTAFVVVMQLISAAIFWITFHQLESIQKGILQQDKIIIQVYDDYNKMLNLCLDIDSRLTKLVKLNKDVAIHHEKQNQCRAKDIQRLYKRSKYGRTYNNRSLARVSMR